MFKDGIMRFSLSLPPSKNVVHVRTRFGKALSHKARKWLNEVISSTFISSAYLLADFLEHVFTGGMLVVEVDVYFPDKRKRDAHNVIDILADSLEQILSINDTFFLIRIMKKAISKDSPRVEVRIFKEVRDC